MFTEIIRAILLGAVPIFILSYLMLSRAMSSEKYQQKLKKREAKSAKTEYVETSTVSKTEQTNKFDISEHAINKWLFFGGNFYGTMAFATFLAIEFDQIIGFFGKLFDLTWSQVLGAIGFNLLVNFFIESIMNMISAFIWFIYWPKHIDMLNGWIWLIAAYVAFTLAVRLTEKMPASVLIKYMLARFSKNEPQA